MWLSSENVTFRSHILNDLHVSVITHSLFCLTLLCLSPVLLLLLVPQVIELYRLLAVGISLWNQFAVPVLFSVFWFVLFIVQLCSDTMSGSVSVSHQGVMFFLLTR